MIPEKALGFQTSLFTFFPLPRTNVGNEFRRTVNFTECVYMDPLGIPHTSIERRWIEIITTLAKRTKDNWVELGSISNVLAKYGMARSNEYILPARKALYKFANLHISTMRIGKVAGIEAHQALNFAVAKKAQILWARGRTDLVVPELFDGQNFVELSPEYMDFVKKAAPHNQDHYMQIQSPLELDLYHWIVTKLYTQKDKELVKWATIYAQFGQSGGILSENQMRDIRRLIKKALESIKQNYYPKAKVYPVDEGLMFMKSPPLIEPDHKKAGFSLT